MVKDVFSASVVAVIFAVAIVLNLVLPKKMGINEEEPTGFLIHIQMGHPKWAAHLALLQFDREKPKK